LCCSEDDRHFFRGQNLVCRVVFDHCTIPILAPLMCGLSSRRSTLSFTPGPCSGRSC
jgi:hypothetical protein